MLIKVEPLEEGRSLCITARTDSQTLEITKEVFSTPKTTDEFSSSDLPAIYDFAVKKYPNPNYRVIVSSKRFTKFVNNTPVYLGEDLGDDLVVTTYYNNGDSAESVSRGINLDAMLKVLITEEVVHVEVFKG